MTREPEDNNLQETEPNATPPPEPVPEEEQHWPRSWEDAETSEIDAEPASPDWAEPSPLAPAQSGGGMSAMSGVLIGILALGLLVCGAWAVKLHREKAVVSASFDETLGLIAEVAPAELAGQLSAVRGDLQVGRLDTASERITTLAGKVKQAMGAGGGVTPPEGGEADYKGLPPDAETFFRQHPDLIRQFTAMARQARQLRDQGQNVQPLRQLRDQVIEAARLGQADKVNQHLTEMARLLSGGPGGAVPGRLGQKVQAFKKATEQAVRQGRDPRAAVAIAHQAEAAAQSGDMEKAEQLLDQALTTLRRAPRGMGGGRGPGGPGLADRMNPLGNLVRVLMQVMQLEERDLSVVWAQLTKLQEGLKGSEDQRQPEILEPFVETAAQSLKTVAERRRELTLRIRGQAPSQTGRQATGPRLGQLKGDHESERRRSQAILTNRLGPLLERIRGLSEADFQRDRNKFLEDITNAVLRPPTPEEIAAADATPTPVEPSVSQADRIRTKLLAGAQALQQRELQDQDVTEINNLFTEARRFLYAKDLERSESAADKALALLGVPLAQFGTPTESGEPGKPRRPSALYDPEATKIRLTP